MKTEFAKYSVNAVWHFTDQSNIASIDAHGGILSYAETMRLGIKIPSPGGNQWSHDADKRVNVDNFVHLAFVKDHPMLYRARQEDRIKNPVWLKIDISVLDTHGTMYTAEVANKAGVPQLSATDAIKSIDLAVLLGRTDWNDPKIRERRNLALKSQILVPRIVPINLILDRING
jgi:hypothetical protein